MKRLIVILATALIALQGAAQTKNASGFGLDKSDAKAVKEMKRRMARIRKHRPTVALVLSGGGAKGAATVGALKYLERYEFPVDMVLGTSIGGLIGGMYALGYTPDYLDTLMRTMDWEYALSDNVDPRFISLERQRYKEIYPLTFSFSFKDKTLVSDLPSGFVNGENVGQIISSRTVGYSGNQNFLDFPIPFFCVATDLVSGRAKVWHSGDINTALRSTMSIPGLFAPVRTDGMVLVDGGMRNNYPVDLAKEMGADIIIGIDISGDFQGEQSINNIYDIAMRSIDLFSGESFQRSLEAVDVNIHPNLEGYGMMSFNAAAVDTMIIRGYKAAEQMAPELDKIRQRLGKERMTMKRKGAVDIGQKKVLIGAVDIDGVSDKEEAYMKERLKCSPGKSVGFADVGEDMSRIFGTGYFEYVKYELQGADEPYTLKIDSKKGPENRVGVGARFDTEELVSLLLNFGINTNTLSGSSLDFTAKVGSNPYLNALYRLRSPVGNSLNVSAKLRWTDRNRFITGDNAYYNISFLKTALDVYVSTVIKDKHEFKAGVSNDFIYVSRVLGSYSYDRLDPSLMNVDCPGLYFSLRNETLDDTFFPSSGLSAGIRLEGRANVLDPEKIKPFGIAAFDGLLPVSMGNFTIVASGSARYLPGETIPLVYANTVGGDIAGRYVDHQVPFLGISNAAFRRNCMMLGRMDFRYRIGKNHFVSAGANFMYDFDDYPRFQDGEFIWGLGSAIAYRTPWGPIKLQVHWSTLSKRLGGYLSVGFKF